MTGVREVPPPRTGTRAAIGVAAGVGLAWTLHAFGLDSAATAGRGVLALDIAVAVAVLLVTALERTRFATAGRWSALFLLGQASVLQLINAGTRLHYQHLLAPVAAWQRSPVALGIVALQVVAIAAALRTRWRDGRTVRRFPVSWWKLGLLALLAAAVSAAPSAEPRAFALELASASVLQFVAVVNLLLAVRALPAGDLTRWHERLERRLAADAGPIWRDRVVLGAAAFVMVTSAMLCLTVYQRHPHVQDEVKYLLQARYFAHGMLAMPVPPVPEAFRLYLFDVGRHGWYSVVPPGWSLFLALPTLVDAAWLLNPVLAAVNTVLAAVFVARLYDRRLARVVAVLLSLSPWNVFLAMSFMSHTVTLTLALVAALGVMRARETGAARWTWMSGIAIGLIAVVRQLDGMVLALLLGLWAIGIGGVRLRLRGVFALVVGTALTAALILPYNRYFTGHPLTFPIMEYHNRLFGHNSNAYGFGPDRGMGWPLDPYPGHSPRDAVINTSLNSATMNVELSGWAFGALIPLLYLIVTWRTSRSDRLMLAVIVGIAAAYFPNYFSGGPDFGARYWYLALLPGLVLVARGVDALGRDLAVVESHPGAGPGRASAALVLLTAGAAFLFMPWRAADKYYHYLDARPDLGRMAAHGDFGDGLVLVRGVEHPDYTSAAMFNPIDLRAEQPIFAHAVDSAEVADVVRAYPDRSVWIVDGPSRTGAGYRVVAGPLPPEPAGVAEAAR